MPLPQDLQDLSSELDKPRTPPAGGRSSGGLPQDLQDISGGLSNRRNTAPSAEDDARGEEGIFSMPDWSTPGHLLKGAGKGLVGQGVGVGQLIADIDPTGTAARIGASEPAQAIRNWAMAPSESTAESIAYGAGAVTPYLFGPGEALGAGRIANTALGAYRGAGAGLIQPTKEGTLSSHGKGAAVGAVLGTAPRSGIHAIAWGLRHLGVPVPHIPAIINMLWRHGRNAANSQAAQRMQQSIYQAGGGTTLDAVAARVRPGMSSAAGVGAGQMFGPGVQPDAENQ